MIVTAQTYRDAAQRLRTLAQAPQRDNTSLGRIARDWALSFDGAAAALEHHQPLCREDNNAAYAEGHQDGRQGIEPDLIEAKQAIDDYLSLIDSPAPEWRSKALDGLGACARGIL